MRLRARIERAWTRRGLFAAALLPAAMVFRGLSALRRAAYRRGLLRPEKLPVPVIVIGNVSVGGTGKTPLAIHLVEALRAAGLHPGVVSRGYGGAGQGGTVNGASDPVQYGDEPVLIAARCGVPVQVGADRVAAARQLLGAYPEVNVLLSDDGLQHYRLARDIEIAVVDAQRGFGNGWPLPAGPLREPVSRLRCVDALVANGAGNLPFATARRFEMRLMGSVAVNLADPAVRLDLRALTGRPVHAIAGIGNPQRFFDHLSSLGLTFTPHSFPDHHVYRPGDLRFDGDILMTEKDGVKCRPFDSDRLWVVPVTAEVPGLAEFVLDRLRSLRGSEAA